MRYRSERRSWSGDHRGVAFEVVQWWSTNGDGTPREPEHRYGQAKTWNYYLILAEKQVPPGLLEALNTPMVDARVGSSFRYRKPSEALATLEWHGGMTFYEIGGGLDGEPRTYKAGCDFNHYWDEERRYSLEGVAREAKCTIDDLLNRWPDIRVRCWRTGEWCLPEEGVWPRNGSGFESLEAIYQQNAELDAEVKD